MAQFLILNAHPRGPEIAHVNPMTEKIALSDQLEERLVDFAGHIINLAGCLRFGFHQNRSNPRRDFPLG